MEDPNAPATKGDLAEVKEELKGDIAEVKTQTEQLRSEVNHMYNDLVERIADSETRLLKALQLRRATSSSSPR